MSIKKDIKLKAGEKIIYFGQVFKIFKIKKKKGIVVFHHYFKTNKTKSLVYSMPAENLKQRKFRKPFSKLKLNKMLAITNEKTNESKNIVKIKESLSQNNLRETLEILKDLTYEKASNPDKFTATKASLYKTALTKIQEEIAVVFNISLNLARKKIQTALERSCERFKKTGNQK